MSLWIGTSSYLYDATGQCDPVPFNFRIYLSCSKIFIATLRRGFRLALKLLSMHGKSSTENMNTTSGNRTHDRSVWAVKIEGGTRLNFWSLRSSVCSKLHPIYFNYFFVCSWLISRWFHIVRIYSRFFCRTGFHNTEHCGLSYNTMDYRFCISLILDITCLLNTLLAPQASSPYSVNMHYMGQNSRDHNNI